MAELIAETTFLIDLERETSQGGRGPATTFLREHADTRLAITPTIAGELACGPSLSDRERWRRYVSRFRQLRHDEEVAWHYGAAYRYLRPLGLLIGSNDLWIAAASLAHATPVLTRNVEHFRRVPGIEVVGY